MNDAAIILKYNKRRKWHTLTSNRAYHICCVELPIKGVSKTPTWYFGWAMLVSLSKAETAVHGCQFLSFTHEINRCFSTKSKEKVCVIIEFNSRSIGSGLQHGRRLIVWGLQHGGRDVMWKLRIDRVKWLCAFVMCWPHRFGVAASYLASFSFFFCNNFWPNTIFRFKACSKILFFLGHLSFIRNNTQTAVTNIRYRRITFFLTFRKLLCYISQTVRALRLAELANCILQYGPLYSPSFCLPHLQSESKCEVFVMKISFHSYVK